MAVAEGHDLVAFQLLVPVEADVVTALLGSCCRAIPVDDGDIKKLVLVKFQYGALKNGVDAAIGFPSSPSTIDARVVDLGTTFAILVDRQLLPLTAQIEQVQNVVEDLEQTQLRCRPTAADGKVWQDKLLEQCETQLRGNRLPTMASSHSSPPENRILSDLGAAAENPASRRLSGKFGALEKRTTSCEEAADELVGIQCHRFLLATATIILPLEAYLAILNIEDAIVGNGDAVCIAADIRQDLL